MVNVRKVGWHNFIVPPALQLAYNGKHCLFNVGEDNPRFRYENGLSIGKIGTILFTDTSTSCVDGLLGLMYALQNTTIHRILVCGPPSIRSIVQAIDDFFIETFEFEVCIKDLPEGEFVELEQDNGVTIYGASYLQKDPPKDIYTAGSCSDTRAAYIVIGDDALGTFLPEEAKRLGIKRGPAFGLLKSGISVQAENGNWVTPDQVCEDPIKGRTFIVLHDDSKESWEVLSKALEMVKTFDYIFLMRAFNLTEYPKDLIGNATVIPCDMSLKEAESFVMLPSSYHRSLVQHAYLPQLYPGLSRRPDESLSLMNTECVSKGPVQIKGELIPPLSKIRISPPNKTKICRDDRLFRERQEEFEAPERSVVHLDDSLFGDPAITFLGTGCAVPSPLRNVFSIIVRLTDDFSVLLDAGQGTLQQLYLISKSLEDFIRTICSIKVVFVSHSHADHHAGLGSILAYRKRFAKADDGQVTVIAPKAVLEWMKFYNSTISPIDYVEVVARPKMVHETPVEGLPLRLELIEVDHIPDSYGVKINHEDLWSIVYSGDTRPSDALAKAACGCDILIHEATFHDNEKEEAIKRGHSTVTDALEIAKKSNVGTLILTHVSQRYKMIEEDFLNKVEGVIFAYDLLRIPVKTVKHLTAPVMRAMAEMDVLFEKD